MSRRTNMPLLRSLKNVQGTLAAIDMALPRSPSRWVMVTLRIPRMLRLSTVLLSQRRRRAIFVCLGVAFVGARAVAQDNYEIQVYGSETVPVGRTMVELHSNYTVEGEDKTVNGVLPSEHAFHE